MIDKIRPRSDAAEMYIQLQVLVVIDDVMLT